MTTAVLSSFRKGYSWESLNQIIPSLERAWLATRTRGHSVVPIRFDQSLARQLSGLLPAQTVVIPFWSRDVIPALTSLRKSLGLPPKLVIHTHGEGTKGGMIFEKAKDLVKSGDVFVCASRAEARSLRICFPQAKIRVIPFPIQIPVPSASRRSSDPGRLLYAGRISEQKNLHVLLLSLWILKRRDPAAYPILEIYGRYDRLGSPNFGLRSSNYERSLRALAQRLGLGSHVRWKGFVSQRKLDEITKQGGFTLVSPSQHSDEDFGVAAYRHLSSGLRAVLSSWGGHLDFGRPFHKQISWVPVRSSSRGPCVSATELARAVLRAESAAAKGRGREKRPFGLRPQSAKLRQIALEKNPSAKPLRSSALVQRLVLRKKRHPRWPRRQIFTGYDDPLAQPFFESYGMKKGLGLELTGSKRRFLVPWASVRVGTKLVIAKIQDPIRGSFCLKARRVKTAREVSVFDVEGREYRIPSRIRNALARAGAIFEMS